MARVWRRSVLAVIANRLCLDLWLKRCREITSKRLGRQMVDLAGDLTTLVEIDQSSKMSRGHGKWDILQTLDQQVTKIELVINLKTASLCQPLCLCANPPLTL